MARRSARRRTPIKRTKTYRKGQMQAALVTFLALGVFIQSGLVQQSFQMIQNVLPPQFKKVGG
jgi:hypothetical protein